MLGQWKLQVAESTPHLLKWALAGNRISWSRVRSPPEAARPWPARTRVSFLYASEVGNGEHTLRTVTVTGYKRFARGNAMHARTDSDEPRTYYIHKIFDAKLCD
eukprot:10092130-Karenia_brevis.AAC.1